jgi:hypothetical protein
MSVRAKFKVQSITQSAGWDVKNPTIYTVRLNPVNGNTPENAGFYAATPAGQIELGMVSSAAGGQFAIGQEFFVDFTPA